MDELKLQIANAHKAQVQDAVNTTLILFTLISLGLSEKSPHYLISADDIAKKVFMKHFPEDFYNHEVREVVWKVYIGQLRMRVGV